MEFVGLYKGSIRPLHGFLYGLRIRVRTKIQITIITKVIANENIVIMRTIVTGSRAISITIPRCHNASISTTKIRQ